MASKRPRKLKSSQRPGSRAARSVRAPVAAKRPAGKKRSPAAKKPSTPKRIGTADRAQSSPTHPAQPKPAAARPGRAIAPPRAELLAQAAAAGISGHRRMTMPQLRAALARLADQPAATALSSEASLPASTSSTRRPPVAGLPWRYGVTELVAVPVDPLQVHVYWELLPEAVGRVRAQLGASWNGAKQVLRTYDVSASSTHNRSNGVSVAHARHHFDCDVDGEVGNYYLHLWSPEQALIFEIGWLSRDGRFVPAVRSNRIQTPRNAPAQGGAERWITVRHGRILATPDHATPPESSRERAAHPQSGAPWSGTFPAPWDRRSGS